MLGGAAVAWLLGPRLVRETQEAQWNSNPRALPGLGLVKGGRTELAVSGQYSPEEGSSSGSRGRFVDRPPLSWLAYPEGTSFGMGGSRRGRAVTEIGGRAKDQGQGSQGMSQGVDAEIRDTAVAEEGMERKAEGRRPQRRAQRNTPGQVEEGLNRERTAPTKAEPGSGGTPAG